MKLTFLTIFLTVIIYTVSNGQDIILTLGNTPPGVFYLNNSSSLPLITVSSLTGEVNILNGLRLELTGNSPTTGVIFKGTNRFVHNFQALGTVGHNTFVGLNSGNFSMAFSSSSLDASNNTGIGEGSLTGLTQGYFNTAVGYNSLNANADGNWNTGLGAYALKSNTSGEENTAVGYYALTANTTGIENTSVGAFSMYQSTTGNANSGLGYYTLNNNTTGSANTASGHSALFSNTTGRYNTATGFYSLYANTIGEFNTASGDYSLYTNLAGNKNTANGYFALALNLNGNENTASGYNSLAANTGDNNTGIGVNSLNSNTWGTDNTAIGHSALTSSTSGFNNTAVGKDAGSSVTMGSNLTLLGYNAQPSFPNVANEITLGDANIFAIRSNVTVITSLSDGRDKKNIKDLTLGLDFLMKIKPRQFNWDRRDWYENNLSDGSKMKNEPTAGFIAQEFDEIQTGENAEWLHLVLKTNPEKFEASAGNLLPIIVKAIQDLKKENDELKATNQNYQVVNDKLQSDTKELKEELSNVKVLQNILLTAIEKMKLNNTEVAQVVMEKK
ncbi:MAG: tail fiber domain-containing protein [Ignavibacteria bacterium]|nr:tail fiber domain-containing protein [Ignavibacteria bacterium]